MRLRAAIWHLGQIRVCQHASGSPERWIRFVPTRFIGMQGGAWFLGYPENQLSSTRIRRILAEVDNENDMVTALTGVALNPKLLFKYVQWHKKIQRSGLEPWYRKQDHHPRTVLLKKRREQEESELREKQEAEQREQERHCATARLELHKRLQQSQEAAEKRAWLGREHNDPRAWLELDLEVRNEIVSAEMNLA